MNSHSSGDNSGSGAIKLKTSRSKDSRRTDRGKIRAAVSRTRWDFCRIKTQNDGLLLFPFMFHSWTIHVSVHQQVWSSASCSEQWNRKTDDLESWSREWGPRGRVWLLKRRWTSVSTFSVCVSHQIHGVCSLISFVELESQCWKYGFVLKPSLWVRGNQENDWNQWEYRKLK